MLHRNMIKNFIISIATVLCLTGLILFIFRDNLSEIHASLQRLSGLHVLCLAGAGICYQLLDALAQYLLIRSIVPSFRYRQAVEISYLGVFGQVALFSAGSFPLQAVYLHHHGIEVGHTIGLKTLNYAVHKASVVLFATVMLLIGRGWLFDAVDGLRGYLIAGYLICLTIIVTLLLLCTWSKAHGAAVWLLEKLPDRGRWAPAVRRIRHQLDGMYEETAACMKKGKILLPVMAADFLKLGVFCAIPCLCTAMLGDPTVGILQAEVLTGLMLLISGAVPNVAGLGPIELTFYLLYKPFLGEIPGSSALLLFRIATYYFPFAVSSAVFVILQGKLLSAKKSGEGM